MAGSNPVTKPSSTAAVFFPGLVFGWMRARTGSLLPGTLFPVLPGLTLTCGHYSLQRMHLCIVSPANYMTGAELVIDGGMAGGARPRWS